MQKTICCISDTHFKHNEIIIPECDILVHAGDFCGRGTYEEVIQFALWIKQQPAKHIIIVAGNHDLFCEKYSLETKALFEEPLFHNQPAKVYYLENQEVVIDGIRFFGSPYSPEFNNWAFMMPRSEIYNKIWANIPEDTDILITHTPQYKIGDRIPDSTRIGDEDLNVGCAGLGYKIREIRTLKLHICGHIHSGYNIYKNDRYTTINASICTSDYIAANKPILYTYTYSS